MSGHRLPKLSVMQRWACRAMPPEHNGRLAVEQRAQALIAPQLVAASWEVQDKNDVNLFAAEGVAVREAVMAVMFKPKPKDSSRLGRA